MSVPAPLTPAELDDIELLDNKPRCAKPGCGARALIGRPCNDFDCPQRCLSNVDTKKLRERERALLAMARGKAEAEAERDRLKEQLRQLGAATLDTLRTKSRDHELIDAQIDAEAWNRQSDIETKRADAAEAEAVRLREQAATARRDALEEAAKVVETWVPQHELNTALARQIGSNMAKAIRALAATTETREDGR